MLRKKINWINLIIGAWVNIFQFLALNLIPSFFIYLKWVFFYKVFLFYLENLANSIVLLVFNSSKEDLFFYSQL